MNEKYNIILFEINLNKLFSPTNKHLPKEIISLIFEFLSQMIKREQFINIIDTQLEKLLIEVVQLVLVDINEYELYKNSPKTYIYSQFEINDDENCFDIRYSISQFLKIICKYQKRNEKGDYIKAPVYFEFIYKYFISLLKTFDDDYTNGNLDVRYKEAILFLIQSLNEFILK